MVEGPCIEARHLTSDGYPLFGEHRYVWKVANGPIPPNHQVDHKCRNRACVRLGHLELVTVVENQRRKPTTKIPARDYNRIRERLANGERAETIAAEYGVTAARIYQLKKYRMPKTMDPLDFVDEALNPTQSS